MFDLEAGKVVQQFETGSKQINFSKLTNENKNAQKDQSRTLLGLEGQGIYQIDPRIAKNSIANEKLYKSKTGFTSITSTMTGGFAVGNDIGEIRMYKQVGQNAKTLLPGLGEGVKAIDTSQDELWILATCTTYLLVIPTECQSGKTGFIQQMGKEKPTPIKLAIDGRDIVKYQIKNVNFSPARFNNGDSVKENSIVTSTGDYLVTWNFEKVKRGILKSYIIKKMHSLAVEGQFQFNNEEKVLVTLPKEVTFETRKTRKQ